MLVRGELQYRSLSYYAKRDTASASFLSSTAASAYSPEIQQKTRGGVSNILKFLPPQGTVSSAASASINGKVWDRNNPKTSKN